MHKSTKPKYDSPEWLINCATQREAFAATLPADSPARARILKVAHDERKRADYLASRNY